MGPTLVPFMKLRAAAFDGLTEYWKEKRALDLMGTYVPAPGRSGIEAVKHMLQYTDRMEEEHQSMIAADPASLSTK